MRDRFIEIDILRVIAICYVIMVRHIDDYASEMFQCQLVSNLTYVSLGIFVYISGYLLASNTTSFVSIEDIKGFLIKRVLRIYPLYASTLLMFYLLSIINTNQLYSGLFFFNLFNGEYILTLWYVSMIMLFYVIFIALNYKFSMLKLCFISGFIFMLLIIEHVIFKKVDTNLILYFPSFICGILSVRYSNYLKLTINRSISLFSIFLILLFIKDLVPSKLNVIIITLMIISFTLPSLFLFSKLKKNTIISKPFISLSYATFCMYLTHRIIFEIALIIYKPKTDVTTLLYLYLLAIPVIYIVSFYIQKYYDKLFMELLKNNFRELCKTFKEIL